MRNTMANGADVLQINRQNRPATMPSLDIFGSYVKDNDRPAWWIRAGIWTGLLMSAPPPKVWTWNPAVITLCLVIAGLLTGGGWYLGYQQAVIENIKQKADKAASDAATVKSLVSEEAVEPTPTPRRK